PYPFGPTSCIPFGLVLREGSTLGDRYGQGAGGDGEGASRLPCCWASILDITNPNGSLLPFRRLPSQYNITSRLMKGVAQGSQGFSVVLSSDSCCRGSRPERGAEQGERGAGTSLPLRAGLRPASMTRTEKPCDTAGLCCRNA